VRELSLFTGAGGGVLGGKLLGWKTVGYVEINDYCQRVIAQRIKDGIFDEAPIFGDIRAFISEGYAWAYRGMVDVLTAGWPCQDLSVIGTREGLEGERSGLWNETREVIRQVVPHRILLENVPAITTRWIGTVLGDLASLGFDAEWGVLGADAFGAEHHRERFWLAAFSKNIAGLQAREKVRAERTARRAWQDALRSHRRSKAEPDWFLHQSYFDRGIDDVAHRVDRAKAIGNGQVPIVAKTAWELLSQ
jgi:DNA (cytosine-5)-methyltransferase 1